MSIRSIKGGTLVQAEDQPNYSFVSIKEITYTWLCTPSWQLNFGIGLLINWRTTNRQDRSKLHQASSTDYVNTNIKTLSNIDNNSAILKPVPLATIGIRYITHTQPFFRPGNHPIR